VALKTDLPAVSPVARGDELSVRTVISNLVHNGIQYSYRGGVVTVGARCDESGVTIEVRDTGIGIPADKQSVIFDDFVRLPHSGRESHAGTGLGLTICRTLVQQLQGTIEVASREHEGSVFTVRLPEAGSPAGDKERP
jgi:signal transduction histidine kinase